MAWTQQGNIRGPQGLQGPPGAKGDPGEDGKGISIAGSVATYAALPSGLGAADAGKGYLVEADGLLYIWSGTSFPANGSGVAFKGDKGDKGDAGEQGPQGIQGPQGPKGDTGNTGATGATGAKGDQGEPGPAGANGTKWFTGSGAPGVVSGSTAGDLYLDTVDGSVYRLDCAMPWNEVANLQGPPGRFFIGAAPPAGAVPGDAWFNAVDGALFVLFDDGDSSQWVGVSGAVGSQGPAGVDGEQGPQGPQGAQGPAGAAGATGPKGEQGPQGIQGPPGETGPAGDPAAAALSLSNDSASRTLPSTGSVIVSSFAQTVRNCLRWLTERFDSNGSALNAVTWDGAKKTISTSAPSGGANGDIWFQREA